LTGLLLLDLLYAFVLWCIVYDWRCLDVGDLVLLCRVLLLGCGASAYREEASKSSSCLTCHRNYFFRLRNVNWLLLLSFFVIMDNFVQIGYVLGNSHSSNFSPHHLLCLFNRLTGFLCLRCTAAKHTSRHKVKSRLEETSTRLLFIGFGGGILGR